MPKKGEVWVNKGFEVCFPSRFYHSVVRVMEVITISGATVVMVKSIADTMCGDFGTNDTPFPLTLDQFNEKFRFKQPGDLERFRKHRQVNKVLYADSGNRATPRRKRR